MGDRLKGIVVNLLEGSTGKKAWVRVGIMRASKGGKLAFVDGMIRLSKEKGLKPRKVAVDKPLTVYVTKVGLEIGARLLRGWQLTGAGGIGKGEERGRRG